MPRVSATKNFGHINRVSSHKIWEVGTPRGGVRTGALSAGKMSAAQFFPQTHPRSLCLLPSLQCEFGRDGARPSISSIFAVDGELAGTNAGTDYDQLCVSGSVNLGNGNSTLGVTRTFAPATGTTFTIIGKLGAGAISGTFTNMPEGKLFGVGGLPFQITYAGGNGNDVVLTRVQAPAVTNMIALLTNTQVRITAQGIAGVSYVIEATTNLAPPVVWAAISTNTADSSGLIQFVQQNVTQYPQRYYRIASP